MRSTFAAAFQKMVVLGSDPTQLVDCSDVIPVPPPFTGQATLPAGLNHNDIEQAVRICEILFK